MTKREKIFNKYCGKCAYCGCELNGKWHVDHASPLYRKTKTIGGDIVSALTGLPATETDIENRNYKITERKSVPNGCHYPERNCIENMMPACISCNTYKGGCDIEIFRMILQKTIPSLNKHYPQYRFAKKFGLITETNIEVKFYFEKHNEIK